MQPQPIGHLLRDWRQRRRLSQLDLACDAEISTKHLSFLETGRALPSREMLLRLAEQLDVPLRERNVLLSAAGYAPVFSERSLDDPSLQAAWRAINHVLKGYEPYPALVIDRHWTLLAANAIVPLLLGGISASMLQPPVNVLRLSLHPDGLAPRIANFAEWRAHIVGRLRRQVELTADPILQSLLDEIKRFQPTGSEASLPVDRAYGEVAIPLQLRTEDGLLTFVSTTMVFGTPVDVTLSELALEAFFPADAGTAEALRRLAMGVA